MSEDLQGNDKHIFGNWKKGDPSYIVVERSATLSPAVTWKVEHMSSELRRFPSKLLKVPNGFFLLLLVKCKRREINCGKDCSQRESRTCWI